MRLKDIKIMSNSEAPLGAMHCTPKTSIHQCTDSEKRHFFGPYEVERHENGVKQWGSTWGNAIDTKNSNPPMTRLRKKSGTKLL
jgi:hypothetical protein